MVYTARLQTLWQVKIGDDYGVVAKAAQAHSWNPIVKLLKYALRRLPCFTAAFVRLHMM